MSIDHVRGSGGPTPRAREDVSNTAPRDAWQREMERAQMAGWFQPPLNPNADVGAQEHPVSPQPTAATPALLAWQAVPAEVDSTVLHSGLAQASAPIVGTAYGLSSTPLTTSCPSALDTPLAAVSWAALWASVTTSVTAVVQSPIAFEPTAPEPPHLPRTVTSDPASQKPADISVHIEPAAQGVAVWVGLPAHVDEPAECLDALLHALRQRLRQEGAPLQSLTVNGRTVWSAPLHPRIPSTPQES